MPLMWGIGCDAVRELRIWSKKVGAQIGSVVKKDGGFNSA